MLKQLSSAAILISALTGQQAHAGVAPPVVVGAYYEQNGTAKCGPSASGSSSSGSGADVSTCLLLFPAPPAGKQLSLTETSCSLQTIGSQIRDLYLAQNVNGAIKRLRYLKPLAISQNGPNVNYYSSNDQLNGYVVNAPVRVVLDLVLSGTIFIDCQISGTLQSVAAP